MKLKSLLVTLALLLSTTVWAQLGAIKGTVVMRGERLPIASATIQVAGASTSSSATTNAEGQFTVEGLPHGEYTLTVEAYDFEKSVLNIRVTDYAVNDLGYISLVAVAPTDMQEVEVEFFDTETGDDFESSANMLSGSKDVYDNIAGYKFGAMRFRNRGYEFSSQNVHLNGVLLNDAMTGYSPWSLWTGLNEATRNQEYTANGISDFGLGGIGGVTNVNARASQMRQGFRASVVNANGQYRFRGMVTYASGVQDNGWSYAASFSTRQGGNDWMDGVVYNTFAYFGSVEKRINAAHNVGLTVFGSPTVRGVQGSSTQEVYDLMGSNFYNPNWGYQSGDMRNARVKNYHEPVINANYEFTPNDRFALKAGLNYRFGSNGYSALDWYDTADPRPDYYRNLPSYFDEEPNKKAWATEGWLSQDPSIVHLDWERMYNVNYTNHATQEEVDNMGGNVTTDMLRSKYVIEERHADQRDFIANLVADYQLSGKSNLKGGVKYRHNTTNYYKEMKDLMGGDFYINIDQFAERDFGSSDGDKIQNDLANPYQKIVEGDVYGYNYLAHLNNADLWGSYKYSSRFVDAYAGAQATYTNFNREGLYEKGLFPGEESLGKAPLNHFLTYTAKAGVSYKINGHHTLSANVVNMTQAPTFYESYVSPRTRNTLVDNLSTEKITSVDLNYNLNTSWITLRLSGFVTTVQDQSDLISFYDDLQKSFTNFSMTGIDQRHMGVELGFSVPLLTGLALEGAVSMGDYIYTSNPRFTQTTDNNAKVIQENIPVYYSGLHVAGTPQTAINLGLDYAPGNNLYLGLDASYFARNYLDLNPLSRTDKVLGLNPDLLAQEEFAGAFLMNASIGKSWYIGKYNLGLSLEGKNLLNKTNIRTGGYEQMRLDEIDANGDDKADSYERFDPKYFYMYGTTYYLNLYFRF